MRRRPENERIIGTANAATNKQERAEIANFRADRRELRAA
jgi:hypothetical protein